ncbi:MAG: NAD(P)/FAD-dependent oxidoreductase [Anaerolineales bacterium]|nr:MAG: NAD(P)/FAD-dependent oxidoreductase [Anaerolineales bacterium]
MSSPAYDAVVVGAGPNGLAGALRLAEAGASVLVLEGAKTIGGGTRTVELTLPGFMHDVCSAVHPLALASPFFRRLGLDQEGLRWIHPPVPLAHPLDDGSVVLLERSPETTASGLGPDKQAYLDWVGPPLAAGIELFEDLLAPLHLPQKPIAYARFGWQGFASARQLVQRRFHTPEARALMAGLAAHSMLPLEAPLSSAFGLVLGTLAHLVGWPFAVGGSQNIAQALARRLELYGGRIETGQRVEALEGLPPAEVYLLNVTPRQALKLVGKRFNPRYQDQLNRYRYGPGIFKIDYALEGPIPWRAGACHQAGTVHLGGTFDEIAGAERAVWQGEHPDQPFVLLAQPTLFDGTRAPAGKHIAWAYTHVPSGSTVDRTAAVEAQIERFAPGFRDRILARHTMTAQALEAYNPNYIGGDINAGALDWRQFFARQVLRRTPYATSDPMIYLCSSSTPPGGGVHGMSGFHAAEAALRRFAF